MTDRQRTVLKELVHLYIKTGNPQSSREISEHLPFSLSAPSIRLELALLQKLGFVEHPHTSSGSIPTAKAFRELFRAGDVQEKEMEVHPQQKQVEGMADVVSELSRRTHLVAFGVGNAREGKFIVGFQHLGALPEFHERDVIEEFFTLVDRMGTASREEFFELLPEVRASRMFIGSELPFADSELFGLVASRPSDSRFLAVLGPLRMDYARVASLLNETMRLFRAL